MPYQESPYFKTPPNCKKIWRYMPIDKFMAMLSEESLYFPNVYLFNDRYEGILSSETSGEVCKIDLLNAKNTPVKQDEGFIEQKDFIERSRKFYKEHKQEHEMEKNLKSSTLISNITKRFFKPSNVL